MTGFQMLLLIALLLVAGGAGVAAWIRWRRWRGDEQDTRLLTGIVDLRRRFREGEVDERLPAKGRGFARDVETAVNRLLDEAAAHVREYRAEARAFAQALDLLGGVVTRNVEQLETTARQMEELAAALGRRGSTAGGDAPFWESVDALAAGDERFVAHCQTAAALAERSRAVAAQGHGALEHLRATLADLAHEAAGTTEGVRVLRVQWTELRTALDGVAQAAGTSEVLAVNAALAAHREGNGSSGLGGVAAEADEVAHDAARAVTRVTGLAAVYEDQLACLTASDAGGRLGLAAAEASELDRALGQIQDLPPTLAGLATALSGMAESQAQATANLSAARPDAARLADELQTWTVLTRRMATVLVDAAGVLTVARHEARRLLEKEEPA